MRLVSMPAALAGRILLAVLFILAGVGKFADIAGTGAYMAQYGLPSILAAPVAVFEVLAGGLLILGLFQRMVSLGLAAFCIVSALIFHSNLADQMQMTMFLKNIALAGGFLMVFAYASVATGYDTLRARKNERIAEEREEKHEAERDAREARRVTWMHRMGLRK